MAHEKAEVLGGLAKDLGCDRGGGRFKSNGRVDDLSFGISSRHLDRIRYTVNYFDIRPISSRIFQRCSCSRNPKHIAEGGDEMTPFSELNRLIYFRGARHTNGAAWTANHLEPIGKK